VAGRAALLGSALIGAGCSRHDHDDEASDAGVQAVVDVKIDSVRVGSIPELLRVTGRTQALRRENVGSPVDGQVVSLRVLEGDRVRAGDVLARVETRESVAARTGAQLLLSQARDDAERRSAEAEMERARHAQTSLEIRAPFDAIVAARAANEGEFVSTGATLVTLVDPASLCFVARLQAPDLVHLAVGQSAQVQFESAPDHRFRCRVANAPAQVDPATQLASVRLEFQEPVELLGAEHFGTADIEIARHAHALLVPRWRSCATTRAGNAPSSKPWGTRSASCARSRWASKPTGSPRYADRLCAPAPTS
jgi:multidrug efflux pump subunit AcrA (membrane-fusion protein)